MNRAVKTSKHAWDVSFTRGRWDCLDKSPIERARLAVVGMLARSFCPGGRILDIGCGEGTLWDFLDNKQKIKYQGIDFSKVAVKRAVKKRGRHFKCLAAEDYCPPDKVDLLVFSEILYYVQAEKVLHYWRRFLKKDGLVAVSLYETVGRRHSGIWRMLRRLFTVKEMIKISPGRGRRGLSWRVALLAKKC